MKLFTAKKQKVLVLEQLDSMEVEFSLPKQFQIQIDMIGLTKVDIKRLKALQPIVEKHTDDLVKNFYDTIMKEISLMEIIHRHSSVDKLGKTLYNHIIQIFSGKLNQDYIEQRKRIAHVHVRIGLGLKWYVNAFQQLMNAIVAVLNQEIQNKEELFEAVSSIQKIFSLEQQLVLESFEIKESDNRKEKEAEKEHIRLTMKQTAIDLSAITEETSASIEELVHQFTTIQILTNAGQDAIQRVEDLSEDGKDRMGQGKESAQNIKKQISGLQKEIEKMIEVSLRVDNVVDVVDSIANQINLLALNASIESARAGEYGKGFAVVANEIRNLSNQTKQSTEDIASLIKEISTQVSQVKQFVRDFNEDIEKNQEITDVTLQFFNQIVEAVKHSKEKTNIVFNEINQSEEVLKQINEATNEITRTADMLTH